MEGAGLCIGMNGGGGVCIGMNGGGGALYRNGWGGGGALFVPNQQFALGLPNPVLQSCRVSVRHRCAVTQVCCDTGVL